MLNLTHRDSDAQPQPLVPGQWYRVRIPLCGVAQRLEPGHRLRLALSTTYWPIAWPSPVPAKVTVRCGSSLLRLPRRVVDPAQEPVLAPFGEPEGSAPGALEEIRPRNTARSLDHLEELIGEGRVDLRRTRDRGAWRTVDTDEEYDTTGEMRFSIQADDPLSAEQEINLQTTMGRPGWHIRTEAQTVLRCNADTYLVEASLAAWDGEEQVFHRRWEQRIPRDQQ